MLAEWLSEYARRDRTQSFEQWLAEMIQRRAELAREQALREAAEVIEYIDDSHELHDDLRQHRRKGKSRASWIAQQVEKVATWAQARPEDVAALVTLLSTGRVPNATDGDAALRQPRPQWNDISRIDFARVIEQCAQGRSAGDVLLETGHDALLDAGRDVLGAAAERLLADYPEAGRLVQDYLQGRLDPTLRNGMQATLASATSLAARRGLLGHEVLELVQHGDVLPGWFAHQTWLGTERMRVLHDLGTGRLDPAEAVNQLADHFTALCIKAGKEVGKRVGGQLGEKLAGKVPYLGPFLAPVGRKVGSWVGGEVGAFAGSKTAQYIRKGASAVKNVAEKTFSAAKSAVKSMASSVSSTARSFCSAVSSWLS